MASSDSDAAPPASALAPIWLAVLVQMLGVGVTLSTLPLYLFGLGCTPNQQAACISGFSFCQMLGCPLLVTLSAKVGRLTVLRACLAGNALASLLTARASGLRGIFFARCLAGLTAASVPVAQVAVADLVPAGTATSKALSRVSAAASMGIICGPGFSALVTELGRLLPAVGDSAVAASRLVFLASGVFASIVLLLTARVRLAAAPPPPPSSESAAAGGAGGGAGGRAEDGAVALTPRDEALRQLVCRWTALVCSSSVVVAIGTYALFALNFLGYGQREVALSQSSAAAAALHAMRAIEPRTGRQPATRQLTCYPRVRAPHRRSCVNLLFLPRLFRSIGETVTCALGLVVLGLGLSSSSVLQAQPLHAVLFLLARVGHAVADTTCAALTARNSSPARRGRNLALLQSTQSASRIFSPLLASSLYTASLAGRGAPWAPPGTLPFLACGSFALLTAPVTLLLRAPRDGGKE